MKRSCTSLLGLVNFVAVALYCTLTSASLKLHSAILRSNIIQPDIASPKFASSIPAGKLFGELVGPRVAQRVAQLRTNEKAALAEFGALVPNCDRSSIYCVGIVLHVVMVNGKTVQNAKWLQAQVGETKRLFAPVGIEFEVAKILPESDRFARVDTRDQRDAIGKESDSAGLIHVYVVEKLGDVDRLGQEIRGVHWRRRNKTSMRWIIISKIAMPGVLSHELGHFFGLPHSTYVESLMNKRPRKEPKWSERVFAPPELAIIESRRDRMLEKGRLENRAKRPRQ